MRQSMKHLLAILITRKHRLSRNLRPEFPQITLSGGISTDGQNAELSWTVDGEIPIKAANVKLARSPQSAGQTWEIILNSTDLSLRAHVDAETFGAGIWNYRVIYEDAQGNDIAQSNAAIVTFPTQATIGESEIDGDDVIG